MTSTSEYSKIIHKLDDILFNDSKHNDFEKKMRIINEIINPLFDKAFYKVIKKERLEDALKRFQESS